MALHPDDPPISLFGLPRIVSNQEDYQFVLDQYKSHNNGITFCTGSLASNSTMIFIKCLIILKTKYILFI